MGIPNYWTVFLLCSGAILYCGVKLTRYGDMIAERTGMGRTWIGLVLMATVTSLPELMTGVGSVTYADAPDIAVGDIAGSCAFNMLLIAILDLGVRDTPLSTRVHRGHTLSAGFGVVMLCIMASGLYASGSMPKAGWVGASSIVIMLVYPVAMKALYRYEKREFARYVEEAAARPRHDDISLKKASVLYALNAGAVVLAAIVLPGAGKSIAVSTGMGQTFVGNVLIAVSTSLPEIVVSLSAVRMGAVDLAVGNLFGSNIFNVMILAIDDAIYTRGPLLANADPLHMVSALAAIAMTGVAVIGLTYRAERKRLPLAWDAMGMTAIYAAGIWALYAMR